MPELKSYAVWDASTRWFHWINALCVLALATVGFLILNAGELDVSNRGKVTLKTIHTWIGYVFVFNLVWRIVWAFFGNRYARWRSILPGGKGYFLALRGYLAAFLAGHHEQYVGHNPAGRLGIAVLLLIIVIQAITGLILAGTDLFYPPIGRWIAQWVAAPDVAPASLVPYAPEMYDATAYEAMRAFRKPIVLVHLYTFYVMVVVIVMHIAAVIVTEVKEGGSIISAMFTGRKILSGRPVDADRRSQD
ncbi:MAG: cytochrome b/b6 domain-containing protein [Pseudomonadota bacterium]